MACHICGQEAIDRCYTCGKLFCASHGRVNCERCETAIAEGDTRADRVSTIPLRSDLYGRPAWWRSQEAEDFEPPSCHICRGLSRTVCSNCRQNYCSEHAGPAQLCRDCGRSSLMGIWCMLAGLSLMGCILLWGFLSEYLGPLSPEQRRELGRTIFGGLLVAACYVVAAVSCRTLFRKAGKPGWMAFVPVLSHMVLFELAGKPRWWVLLYFLCVPIIVLQVLAGIGLARNFGRSQEFGVGIGLLPLVFLPILACSDDTYRIGEKPCPAAPS